MRFKNWLFLGGFFCVSFLQAQKLDKFYVGIYTMDYDSPQAGTCQHPNNAASQGHDWQYLSTLQADNFNCIVPWHQYLKPTLQYAVNQPDTSFLGRAHSLGLGVILTIPENHHRKAVNIPVPTPYDQATHLQALAYYGKHPAVLGWHVSDEPGNQHFETLQKFVSDIKTHYPDKIPYINLLPTYASENQLLNGMWAGWKVGAASKEAYQSHISAYLSEVSPTFIGVDHYEGFEKPSDVFYNLEVVRSEAKKANLPMWWVITPDAKNSASGNPARFYCGKQATRAEAHWKLFSALVYGSKSIFYWTREYMYAENFVGENIWDGMDSLVKQHLREKHALLIDKSDILTKLNIEGVYHFNNICTFAGGNDHLHPNNHWWRLETNPLAKELFNFPHPFSPQPSSSIGALVVSVGRDEKGGQYFWLFNKDPNQSISFSLRMKKKNTGFFLQELLSQTLLSPNKDQYLGLCLEAGEAKLFKVLTTAEAHVSNQEINFSTKTTEYQHFIAPSIQIKGHTNIRKGRFESVSIAE